MSNILIVYGSRYGSTKQIAHHIGETLTSLGNKVDVVDAQKTPNLDDYELIIVGSGIQAGNWKKETKKFLEKNRETLRSKKTALFVSCGDALEPDRRDEAYQKYLVAIAESNELQPIAYGLFGGSFDFNGGKGLVYSLFLKMVKRDFEKKGIATEGLYDFRDWDDITAWAKELDLD